MTTHFDEYSIVSVLNNNNDNNNNAATTTTTTTTTTANNNNNNNNTNDNGMCIAFGAPKHMQFTVVVSLLALLLNE